MRRVILLPAVALALFAVLPGASPAHAQGRGGGRGTVGFGGRAGFARPMRRGFFNGAGFLSVPYYYPDYDYDYEAGPYYDEPAPRVVIAPPPAQAAARPAVEPLLLEYRDGQWVRVPTGNDVPASPQPAAANAAQASAAPQPKLPPAVLVFRDGHQEEVEKYTIQGDTIFTPADYWTTGSWQRKIALASLDIPATLKINQDRGGKFNLPTGPNEVMVRF
jgi:hypothetical protein